MSGSADNPETYGDLPVGIDPTFWYGRQYAPPASLEIWHIQDQMAGQINGVFGNLGLPIQAYIFPEYDIDTWWQGSEIAFILIVYHGTALGKPLNTNAMTQEVTHDFSLVVAARTVAWPLRGNSGVYGLVAAVEAALTGFRPAGCRNIYFTDERFSEKDPEGGIWLFEMKLHVITMRVKMDENYILANLQSIIGLIYQYATPNQPVVISSSLQLGVPANTVVTGIVTSDGKKATLGTDYRYSALSGNIWVQPDSKLLVPGTTVTVYSAPIIETISAP